MRRPTICNRPARGSVSSRWRPLRIAAAFAASPLLGSCTGIQSALSPAGEEAAQVATLFWVMTAGGFVIWALVVLVSLYASRWKRSTYSEEAAGRLILWAGVAFPVTVLAALLAYALWLMPSLRPFASADGAKLRIEIVGGQFWWHVVYHRDGSPRVVSANEIRLPVGERVEFELTSRDMIHSFWIPSLGGKMDLIPGRTNRLSLLAIKAGTYRGQCAEFCGTSHALMAFPAIAMEPTELVAWLDARGRPSPGVVASGQGKDIFLREDCGDCHRVDGTTANGTSGPDLSHVGSRVTIGAGLFENETKALARFIAHSGSVKRGSLMPAYLQLSEDELDAIAVWLKGLE
jgi:cytochrome c oxidase subunit II